MSINVFFIHFKSLCISIISLIKIIMKSVVRKIFIGRVLSAIMSLIKIIIKKSVVRKIFISRVLSAVILLVKIIIKKSVVRKIFISRVLSAPNFYCCNFLWQSCPMGFSVRVCQYANLGFKVEFSA